MDAPNWLKKVEIAESPVLVNFVEQLSCLGGMNSDFWDQAVRSAEDLAKKEGQGKIICKLIIFYALCCNREFSSHAAYQLRKWMESGIISPSDGLAILAHWERHPTTGFEPNLSATVYEHLFDNSKLEENFARWRKDALLRKRYIEVAYSLPLVKELEVYEWAVGLGELDAVRASISMFERTGKYDNLSGDLKQKWDNLQSLCRLRS